VVGVAALVLLLLAAPDTRERLLRPALETEAAAPGTVERVTTARFILVREEVPVKAPTGGLIHLRVADGERVRVGTVLAEIAVPGEEQARRAEYEAAQADLSAFRERELPLLDQARAGLLALTARLQDAATSLARAIAASDREGIAASTSEIEAIWSDRERTVAEKARLEGRWEELRVAADSAAEALKGAVTTVKAPCPGIVSLCPDGLEARLRPEAVAGLTLSEFFRLETGGAESTGDLVSVRAGETIMKVVDGGRTWLLTAVTPGAADDILLQGWCRLRAADRELRARLVRAAAPETPGGDRLVCLELDGCPPGWETRRTIEASLVTAVWEGVVVPRRALAGDEDGDWVYVSGPAGVYPRRVVVTGSGDDGAVVEGVEPGEMVVTNPWLCRLIRRADD